MKQYLDVEFDKPADRLRFTDHGSWEGRHVATIHLLVDALRTIRERELRSFKMEIHTGDQPPDDSSFCYSKRDNQTAITAIPDWIFWDWAEAGIADYVVTVQQMVRASASPPTSDKLFWIGNPETHPTRKTLLRLAKGQSRMQVEAMGWVGGGIARETTQPHHGNFYTLPEHCQFKYLLDMQGVGYSGRLKVLLFSGRPMFIQDRPLKEFFHNWLVPFEHYIPVAESLDDLNDKLEWALTHEVECARIGAAGQSFALQHLTRDSAVKYLRGIILEKFHG